MRSLSLSTSKLWLNIVCPRVSIVALFEQQAEDIIWAVQATLSFPGVPENLVSHQDHGVEGGHAGHLHYCGGFFGS